MVNAEALQRDGLGQALDTPENRADWLPVATNHVRSAPHYGTDLTRFVEPGSDPTRLLGSLRPLG